MLPRRTEGEHHPKNGTKKRERSRPRERKNACERERTYVQACVCVCWNSRQSSGRLKVGQAVEFLRRGNGFCRSSVGFDSWEGNAGTRTFNCVLLLPASCPRRQTRRPWLRRRSPPVIEPDATEPSICCNGREKIYREMCQTTGAVSDSVSTQIQQLLTPAALTRPNERVKCTQHTYKGWSNMNENFATRTQSTRTRVDRIWKRISPRGNRAHVRGLIKYEREFRHESLVQV